MAKKSARIIPNNLARIRQMRGLSQQDVGFLMERYLGRKLDFTTISHHEIGSHGLSREEIDAYARLYKVPQRLLFSTVSTEQELRQALETKTV